MQATSITKEYRLAKGVYIAYISATCSEYDDRFELFSLNPTICLHIIPATKNIDDEALPDVPSGPFMARKIVDRHTVNIALIMGVLIIFGLACIPPSVDFMMVRSGCMTPDGSKIALTDLEEMSRIYSQGSADKYRLIIDGTNGKVIWKDLTSNDPLVCAEDNSIISVSDTGAKWVGTDKEIVFSKKGEGRKTAFIGMTDKNTIIREDRPYYVEQMSSSGGRRTPSSVKSFNTFPTLLVDKLGENNTRSIQFTDSDLSGIGKDLFLNYLFEKDRMIINSGKQLFSTDLATGRTQAMRETYDDLQRSWETADRYDAIETLRITPDGFIEIYDGKGDRAKLVKQISKRDLKAKVISIIDCCNNGLILLFWESEKYVKIAKIDHLSGEVIWRSESLLSKDQK